MTDAIDATGRDGLRRDAAPWLWPVRRAIGRVQAPACSGCAAGTPASAPRPR